MNNEDILLEELLLIEQQLKISCCDDVQLKSEELPNVDVNGEIKNIEEKTLPCWEGYVQVGMKKNKNGKMVPNCVPIKKKTETEEVEISEKSEKQKIRDPKGGLTAAGRAYFKRTEGANLKPGVKGAANTPEKMRRKGSFLTRFFTNPSGPLVDEKGRATRLALSAAAWGERVPKNAEDAARLAEKGRNLLERYKNTKEKSDELDMEIKNLGQSIGQMAGVSPTSNQAVDHDGDGMIFDGTPQEQRAPYKRQSNDSYEKARRKFVRAELARQGIKRNAKVQDRSKEERDARARARAKYDQMTRAAGEEKQNEIDRAKKKTPATTNPKPADRYPNPSSDRSRKPADRYPNPPDADRGRKPADRYPNPPNADRGRTPADRYPNPPNADRGRTPADRYPNPSSDQSRKPADRYPNPSQRDMKPADRLPNPPKKYPPGQKPSTLEERDKRRGSGGKPRTLEERDRDRGQSGPITPRRSV